MIGPGFAERMPQPWLIVVILGCAALGLVAAAAFLLYVVLAIAGVL